MAKYEKYKLDDEIKSKAYELFDYAKSLIKVFSEWDIVTMPNPERYLAEKRDFIEQPNIFYTEAMKFILCHEYIHAKEHLDKISKDTPFSSFMDYESEADKEAIELIKKGIFPNKINELAVHIGITIGILSMLYFSASTVGKKHPNTEDRLISALEELEINNDSPCWGIALIGIKLWSDQFALGLTLPTYSCNKKAFEEMVKQIKEKNI